MSYVSNMWKPVNVANLGSSATGHAVSSSPGSNTWYNDLLNIDLEFKEKIEKYRVMDMTTDIFRALDIIAEDISSENADDNDLFELDFPEGLKNAQMKTTNSALDKWTKKTKFDYRFFDYVREMLKYGIVLFEEQRDGSLIKLKVDRIKGYELDPKNPEEVKYYLYDRDGEYLTENGNKVKQSFRNGASTSTEELEKIDVKKLLILKVSDEPLGESILEKIFKTWRRLQLLEDSVIIYRIVRAPERRVFYVDIGKMPAHKAETYLERVKNKMRQRQSLNASGSIESDYNPSSMQEDFFLAQSGEGRGSRVETLPGGDNLGRIEDLQYFNKKLALGLRIPPSYLDTYSEDSQGATYNDGRLGTAYIAELRYAGFVKRLQKSISKELFTHFRKYAKKIDVELPEDLRFSIAPPQSFGVYKENELFNALLNTYASAENIESLSKRESMKRFLNMDDDEIAENETQKLLELGFVEKDIKEFPDEVRYNFVYGDGEAGRRWIEDTLVEQGDLEPELSVAGKAAIDTQMGVDEDTTDVDTGSEENV